MDIDYDRIKYEIERMKRVQYNNAIRRNVMNDNDLEEFSNIQLY